MRIVFPNRQIGRRILLLRKAKEMTPEQLAEASGCSLLSLLRLESGTLLEIESTQLSGICTTLGVSLESLTSDQA